jgi:acetyltransferase-like isoleucine patch superfamily enzyme
MLNVIFKCSAQLFLLLSKITGFYHTSIVISKIPFQCGNRIRYFFYKQTLKAIGNNILFSYGVIFTQQDISIGNNVRFGPYCTIGLVDFGNNVMVAQFVHFLSGSKQHGTLLNGTPMIFQPGKTERVTVGNDVWIGAQSVIMHDIANGCVVGAGSVVTKDLTDSNCIYAGNPARFIKKRDDSIK